MPNVFNRKCPRCESEHFERLETYAHCPECFYFEDREQGFEPQNFQELEALANRLQSLARANKKSRKGAASCS